MTLVLSFAHQTRKSFGISPASLSTSLMPCVMVCFATSVVATFSAAPSSTRLTSITSWRLESLSGFPPPVVRKRVVPDPAAPPLAAIAVHNYINGDFVDRENTERTSSCAWRELITSRSSVFWFLRYYYSDLISRRLSLMLLMMLFWLVMTLLCWLIISLRLAISSATSLARCFFARVRGDGDMCSGEWR